MSQETQPSLTNRATCL